jgi:hypothetical protein
MALGVITCPSPDPMDASIERKLHDADAALLHSNDAVTTGKKRNNQRYFLFGGPAESLVLRAGALSNFI